MDENHQDKTESKLITTEDVRWVFDKRSKLWVSKHKKRTGFEDKTRWDWLQLIVQAVGAFAIPLSVIGLIIGVWQFNIQQQTDHEKMLEQQQTDRANLIDQQQQTTLETYLDRMSDLLFAQHLDKSRQRDEVRQVAQARTFTALQNLNPARKGILVHFLYDSGLLQRPGVEDLKNPIISLYSLNGYGPDLRNAALSRANLRNVELLAAELSRADLSEADLTFADLSEADLRGVNLRDAGLMGAYLSQADLRGADLSVTYLFGDDMSRADLRGANLQGANLQGVRNLTQQQLDQVSTCRDAILSKGLICHHNQ